MFNNALCIQMGAKTSTDLLLNFMEGFVQFGKRPQTPHTSWLHFMSIYFTAHTKPRTEEVLTEADEQR